MQRGVIVCVVAGFFSLVALVCRLVRWMCARCAPALRLCCSWTHEEEEEEEAQHVSTAPSSLSLCTAVHQWVQSAESACPLLRDSSLWELGSPHTPHAVFLMTCRGRHGSHRPSKHQDRFLTASTHLTHFGYCFKENAHNIYNIIMIS